MNCKAALLLFAVLPAWAQPAPIKGPLLSNEQWPRPTNLREWTSDVIRISGTEKASETAQGKAFFEWLRLFSRMAVGGMIQAFEGDYGKERYVLDAHKGLFVYGWGYCDTTSRIAEAAWQEFKHDPHAAERVITQHDDGGYHTMFRLRMDGRHGAFDPRYGYYLIERDAPDARVLDWSEIHGNFERNREYRNRCRPFFEIAGLEWQRALLIQPAWFDSEKAWRAAGAPKENVFGDGAYRMGTTFHDMDFTLPRGATVERFWDNSARKFYVPASAQSKREFPFLPSGRFYRVSESSHDANWSKFDPNYQRARAHLSTVPANEGYPADLAGGRTIGQAYGVLTYTPNLAESGQSVIDIRSPYVLVDGLVSATLAASGAAAPVLDIRTLAAKTSNAAQSDVWSEWQPLLTGTGPHNAELGRPRFNGKDVGIHGVYRFQLRLRDATPARSTLSLKLYFENGIMSIPPLFAGRNTLRFAVADASAITAPIEIVYHYQTAAGPRSHRQILRRRDFTGNAATYVIDAPGLIRCRSVSISY
ncbi:MAG: hypothetical protein HZB13_18520 [Acidobacteria bacterium]|nr:hypothetical protein [Acidobacteriota bacterium]